MARIRYNKPPVVEAIIDIQVDFAKAPPSIDALASLGAQLAGDYPIREELRSFGIEVNVESGTEVKTTREQVGFRYRNAQKDRVVQLRTNGMLFSRIPSAAHPYDEWDVSFKETQRIWPSLKSTLSPSQVRRVGVRYINRIRLPAGANTLDQFFEARPSLPGSVPLAIQSFIMRLEVPLPGVTNGMLVIGQGTANDANTPAGHTDVLLDLDVIRNVDIACTNDDAELWALLADLHSRENDLFEAFITQSTRALFA